MSDKKRIKGISYCGECINYNHKKHRCELGAKQENNPKDPFYDDCPIPDVEQLDAEEIRKKVIEEFAERMKELSVKWFESGKITIGSIDEIAEQMKEGGKQ